MKVCDICKTEDPRYEYKATINEKGTFRNLELCRDCYLTLFGKERNYEYLAYKETVEEMTGESPKGESPKKKSWWDIFKR